MRDQFGGSSSRGGPNKGKGKSRGGADKGEEKKETKTWSCDHCDREFSSHQAYGGHQNAHKPERKLAQERKLRQQQQDASSFGRFGFPRYPTEGRNGAFDLVDNSRFSNEFKSNRTWATSHRFAPYYYRPALFPEAGTNVHGHQFMNTPFVRKDLPSVPGDSYKLGMHGGIHKKQDQPGETSEVRAGTRGLGSSFVDGGYSFPRTEKETLGLVPSVTTKNVAKQGGETSEIRSTIVSKTCDGWTMNTCGNSGYIDPGDIKVEPVDSSPSVTKKAAKKPRKTCVMRLFGRDIVAEVLDDDEEKSDSSLPSASKP